MNTPWRLYLLFPTKARKSKSQEMKHTHKLLQSITYYFSTSVSIGFCPLGGSRTSREHYTNILPPLVLQSQSYTYTFQTQSINSISTTFMNISPVFSLLLAPSLVFTEAGVKYLLLFSGWKLPCVHHLVTAFVCRPLGAVRHSHSGIHVLCHWSGGRGP